MHKKLTSSATSIGLYIVGDTYFKPNLVATTFQGE